ncbi:MAG: ROK family transcriptional regulator [Stappiaceae bacterium]
MPRGSVKKLNTKRIIGLIRSNGAMSRTVLTEKLGVTPSTVTRLTNQMLEDGLLSEVPDPTRFGKKGFPSKLLEIRSGSLLSGGVFIDPDRILVGVADAQGNLLMEDEFPMEDRSFRDILTVASSKLSHQMATLGKVAQDFIGCGISYPGQHTHELGRVIRTPQLAHWPTIDVRTDLAPFFEMPVFQMNDAKAACLAEMQYGVCKSYQNFCYIWLSYGIGGAAVIDQNLYLGSHGSAAEFGGLFPKSRPRPSGQDLLDTLNGAGISYDHLGSVPAEIYGHKIVRDWTDRATHQLQWLCLVIARTYAPEAIVLGGSLAEPLIDEIVQRLADVTVLGEDFEIAPPVIVRATTDDRPHLGAAALPLYSITNPSIHSGPAHKGL